MTNASLFVMPSYHEGLPIALLEAMSYDLDVVVSDIPANKLAILKPDDDWNKIAEQTVEVYKRVTDKR